MQILGISGSFRRDSHNTRLLRAAADLLPPGTELRLFDGLAELPPYCEDGDSHPAPAAVDHLRDEIASADALLIATPEYNAACSRTQSTGPRGHSPTTRCAKSRLP
jgi:chromate reductase